MSTSSIKKLFVQTHGCQMNEYDSARMADLLNASHGLEQADCAEDADVILLNTCSIREKAQEKVFHQLGRWKQLKQKKPDLIIGVGGCVASQEGGEIGKRAPFVDLIFGPQTLHRLPEMIEDRRRGNDAVIDISFPEIEKFDRLPEPAWKDPLRLSLSWKGAVNIAPSASCPTPAEKKSLGPLMMSLRKWPVWRVAGLEKSICWAKM